MLTLMEEDVKKEFGTIRGEFGRIQEQFGKIQEQFNKIGEAVTGNTRSIVILEEAVTTHTRSIVLLEDKVVDGNRLLKDIISMLQSKPSKQELPCEDHDERLKVLEFHGSTPTTKGKK